MNQAPPPARERLATALFEARRELIDLSRRNRLLHATRSGPRPHCLEIVVDAGAEELFVALTRDGKQFGFAPLIDAAPAAGELDRPRPGKLGLLQTKLVAEPLARRLLKLFREARTYEEEQGVNILFLAIGFLHWFEDAHSLERSSAPLLLVPVSLERRQGREPFVLRGRDDDMLLNISLAEKLREFGVALPGLPAGDDWLPHSYIGAVAAAVAGQQRWEVEAEGIGLGFFTFSKFLMWRDLDVHSWPDASGLVGNPLIAQLLGEGVPRESQPPLAGDDEPIDRHVDLAAAIHVVDADSSQALCIEEGRLGRDLVIQGPPGTGKSQTIANMIAAAAHDGKTVLFIAEKAAALEVVHSRLKSAGLEPLCLELHSKKATKASVIASLAGALHAAGAGPADNRTVADLRAARDRLNRWAATLHREIRQSGRTPYQVIGTWLKLRGESVRVLDRPLPAAADWDRDRLHTAEQTVDRAAAAVAKLRAAPFHHAWHGVLADTLSPFDLERLAPALDGAKTRADELVSIAGEAATLLRAEHDASCLVLHRQIRAMRLLARVPEGREALVHPAWGAERERIASLVEQGRSWSSGHVALAERVVEAAWESDLDKIRQIIAAYGRSAFRWCVGRYRAAVGELRGLCRERPPRRLADRLGLLDDLIAARAARRAIEEEDEFGRAVLGPIWAAQNTQWPAAGALLAWAGDAAEEGPAADLIALAPRVDTADCAALGDRLEAAIAQFEAAFDRVSDTVRPSLIDIFGVAEIDHAPLSAVASRLGAWTGVIAELNDWAAARDAIEALRGSGLELIADGLYDGSIGPGEARAMADLQMAEALWRCACGDDPDLPRLDGAARDQAVTEFRALDRRRIVLARSEVLASYVDRLPTGTAGEMAVVRGEIGKKKGHRAIRKLMENASSAVQRIKPIFLMSPLSVAQFLPPGLLSFDLAVIDEASQVPPEEALGAIARCRQMIVVGDDKQLPPTNFFRMVADDEDNAESDSGMPDRAADFESILTLARARGAPERMLRWHYRSRHPSLIAVSNRLCYGGGLLLPPSPEITNDHLGVSLVKTPRGHYDRGGSGRNPAEAEMIAAAVEEHLAKCPDRSLGIACFSIAQRDAVDDALQARGLLAAAEAFAPNGERLFVKNLEAVQGDERDIVFISVGYGPDAQGRVTANFGPVSQDGGERRLNVLISRARRQCVAFSPITAGDIPADARPQGTRMLREFLHFAETGQIAAGEVSPADYDSPFEAAVASAIRRHGYQVVPQVGVSGFRIDLGVLHPKQSGRFVLGIECDGAAYHSGRSARDRDRLRQQVLEGLGWQLYRIWSTDWFHAAARETERLLAAIAQACEATKALDIAPPPGLAAGVAETEDETVASREVTRSALAEPYRECKLPMARGADLLGLPPPQLAALAAKVVCREGPIHIDEVARRVRQAFGLDRTGRRILQAVGAALEWAERQSAVSRDGAFWSPQDRTLAVPRCRREASVSLRRPDRIAPCEYRLAIAAVLRACAGAAKSALVAEVAHVLGFERTGNGLEQAISQQIDAMIEGGEVEDAGNNLRLAMAAGK